MVLLMHNSVDFMEVGVLVWVLEVVLGNVCLKVFVKLNEGEIVHHWLLQGLETPL